MGAREQKALDDIAKYGCHVLHVFEEGDLPPFSYSVGIYKTCGSPELIVVGLKQQISHWAINEYHRRVRSGEAFRAGDCSAGFLEGFEVRFSEVHKTHYQEYLGAGRWLYQGDDFPTLQMVWPSTTGLWPWDADATSWFRARQPILGAPSSTG
jgi:hypothetical protein